MSRWYDVRLSFVSVSLTSNVCVFAPVGSVGKQYDLVAVIAGW